MSKENPNAMARECLANAAAEFDKAAAACESQADYLRQAAELLRRGEMADALEAHDKISPLGKAGQEAVEKSAEFLRMLEVADKDYYAYQKSVDIARMTSRMSAEEAKMTLLTHQFSCRDGANCALHKALLARINRG